MSKQFWAVLGVLAAVFIGIIFINNKGSNTTSSNVQPTNHVIGSTSSGVLVMEYGDYQCPACGIFYQTVHDTISDYKDRVQFQFRNLPLTSLHPNAFAGARAAEAAALQGKFWEMHDQLYVNQNVWSSASDPMSYFRSYAQSLQLNMEKFTSDFASSHVNDLINADITAFEKTKADKATPTFFINGKQVDSNSLLDSSGQPSKEAFAKVIDEAIASKKQ
ncbi:thioredoxin domain-containing protein [Candidatus Saccharibacteria bacterium]|nr:thioredoxin domain-containing protein [Candidatus Saccharibacteria bacterium]